MSAEQTSTEAAGPALTVLRGEPTPEELAALVAVLAARAAAGTGAPAARPVPASGWTDRARYVRQARGGFSGSGGWRASALPR